jgi:hypothetical protein
MATPFSRRRFVQGALTGGALAGLGDLNFLSKLAPLSAAETKLPSGAVQFRPEIEPLVQLLENTPRAEVIEVVGDRVRKGLSYHDLLAAIFLAGIRNVQPRPSVGFKFHAVLVMNSAHQASINSPEQHRWLPIFWAIDSFKDAQAQNDKEGGWKMPAADNAKLPSASKAREAFIAAMDSWDESPADAAAAALARGDSVNDAFELLYRYGSRDFRDIGHKAIYVANSARLLSVIGNDHAEPLVRSLAYALLSHGNEQTDGSAAADKPIQRNRELAAKLSETWRNGKTDDAATKEMLSALREQDDEACSKLAVELLNRGIAPQSIWDAVFVGAQELMMRLPTNIVPIHAVTSSNALHFAFKTAADDNTRRLLLLQAVSFVPLFQKAMSGRGKLADSRLDTLEAAKVDVKPGTIEEIFSDVSSDRSVASAKILGYLNADGNPQDVIDAARLLIFMKGTNAHDYKYSTAALEDYYHISPAWRNRYLAGSVFNLKGSSSPDNKLVERTRAALKA